MIFFIIIILIIYLFYKNNIVEYYEDIGLSKFEKLINIKNILYLENDFKFKNNISLIIYNFIRYFENEILIKNNLYDFKFLKTENLIVDFEKEIIKFDFLVSTYKKEGYILNTLIKKNNNNYIIEYIKIIDYKNLSEYILEREYNSFSRIGMKEDVGKRVSVEKDIINKILKSKKKEKNIINYRCLSSRGDNKEECEREYDKYGRLKKRGIYDKPCIKNIECPFYKSNKNYKNEHGGCIKGSCEMPLGIKKLGYRRYDIKSKAICRGCINNKIDCCLEQENNRKLYPNLKSADYLF
tara:strand:- start:321 stop:1208 length:888 start_codon:yes stop_codon:yes gene_type:complete